MKNEVSDLSTRQPFSSTYPVMLQYGLLWWHIQRAHARREFPDKVIASLNYCFGFANVFGALLLGMQLVASRRGVKESVLFSLNDFWLLTCASCAASPRRHARFPVDRCLQLCPNWPTDRLGTVDNRTHSGTNRRQCCDCENVD